MKKRQNKTMILCAKCKKKPDALTEKLCVINYRYEVTARCHGKEETRALTRDELLAAEKSDLHFFASPAPQEKPRRKVGQASVS